jgi:hypothetical protein
MSQRNNAQRALVVLPLAGLAALAVASAAHAGTYVINNCPAAPSPNSDPGPWTIFGSPQAPKASCGGGAGDWIGPRGGSMAPATNAGVQLVVPAGSAITIREAKLWWYVPQESSGATTFAIAGSDAGVLAESTTPLERRGAPDVFALGSSTTSLTLDDYCSADDAGQGCVFGGGVDPDLLLFGSQLTLEDEVLPSGSVTGGGLASAAPLSGVQSIGYDAQDGDSGVRLVTLLVDGQVAAQSDYGAQCAYANFLACPASESGAISWDTANVSDGQHSLALVIENAAQNSRTIYTSAITTLNGQSAAALGAGLGGGLSSDANGARASHVAQLDLSVPGSITRSFSRSSLALGGRLLGALAQPIGGASVDVLEQLIGSSQMSVIAHARTGADGSFLARVPAGPSRTIEVGYRAFAADVSYATQAKVRETVGAGVRLAVSPRRTGSAGTIVLSGRVAGPISPQGAIVELLVHYRGRWEPFRAPRTDSRGHFGVSYQFQGAVGQFPFRAEVPAGQAGFPFGRGLSNVVDVATGT